MSVRNSRKMTTEPSTCVLLSTTVRRTPTIPKTSAATAATPLLFVCRRRRVSPIQQRLRQLGRPVPREQHRPRPVGRVLSRGKRRNHARFGRRAAPEGCHCHGPVRGEGGATDERRSPGRPVHELSHDAHADGAAVVRPPEQGWSVCVCVRASVRACAYIDWLLFLMLQLVFKSLLLLSSQKRGALPGGGSMWPQTHSHRHTCLSHVPLSFPLPGTQVHRYSAARCFLLSSFF